MTLSDLTAACVEVSSRLSGDAPVMVVGHGAVHLVPHAHIENGSHVLLLYVAAEPLSPRGVPGDPPELAPQADRAGALPEVRGAELGPDGGSLALPDVQGTTPSPRTR